MVPKGVIQSDVRDIIRLTMPLAASTRVNEYEILGLLGAGGMGEVYRARDPALKREVAIKVLPSFVSQDPSRLSRFEQEAQAAAALNHPNILAVYQFGIFQGAPYLISELLVGDSLRQVLQRGPLPLRKAIDYGVQIAHGLAAAHEKGIVHRDLKPENLFVAKNGRVKILDFGLAKLIQSERNSDEAAPTNTKPGTVMGTVGYMAPEQVRGDVVDNRTDIFALGAILYEMLTGKRAFHRPTLAETMTAILNDDPPTMSQITQSIPLALQRIVQRLMAWTARTNDPAILRIPAILPEFRDICPSQSDGNVGPVPGRHSGLRCDSPDSRDVPATGRTGSGF